MVVSSPINKTHIGDRQIPHLIKFLKDKFGNTITIERNVTLIWLSCPAQKRKENF
jgi:hypothetical protein